MQTNRTQTLGWNSLAFVALALAALGTCRLLLTLSQFGADPFPQLPLVVIVLVGVLFVGPLHAVAARTSLAGGWASGGLALVAAGSLATQMPAAGGSVAYVLAPATAILGTLGLRSLLPVRGTMLSAMSVYVVCTLLANYTFDSFLPLGDFFLVNVGTFFFGITFTQRDRVHRYGRRAVYGMILFAAAANVALALGLGTPLRYVAVGFLAIVLSETADTEVYQRLLSRRWLTRVASSNAISAPLDTIVFTVLAFAGAPFATAQWMFQVIVTDVIVKYGSGMVAAVGILGGRRFAPDALERA